MRKNSKQEARVIPLPNDRDLGPVLDQMIEEERIRLSLDGLMQHDIEDDVEPREVQWAIIQHYKLND